MNIFNCIGGKLTKFTVKLIFTLNCRYNNLLIVFIFYHFKVFQLFVGPYIRDIKQKNTKIKKYNNSEDNDEKATTNKKEKKDF